MAKFTTLSAFTHQKASNRGQELAEFFNMGFEDFEVNINTSVNKDHDTFSNSLRKAGTGYMIGLSETIRMLQEEGFVESFVPAYDHFSCKSEEIKLFPEDIKILQMIRFENASDPNDQAILYAITCDSRNLKGLYIDSYGFFHDDLSEEVIELLKKCPRS